MPAHRPTERGTHHLRILLTWIRLELDADASNRGVSRELGGSSMLTGAPRANNDSSERYNQGVAVVTARASLVGS